MIPRDLVTEPRSFPSPIFVPYDAPLQRGCLIDRRDRFIAEVSLEAAPGSSVLAHCINPGRMEAFVEIGARVWLRPAGKEDRKLQYSWEAIEITGIDGKKLICSTNTVRPNRLVRDLLEARCLPGLESFTSLHAEQTFCFASAEGREHSGRVDFLLDASGPVAHYIEVKNCHLVYPDGWGYFPDSISERATRHVDALTALVQRGARATVIMVVQRGDVRHGVRPSAFHDPKFAAAAVQAAKCGVRFRAVRADVGVDGTWLTHELQVDLHEHESPHVLAAAGRWWEQNRANSGWTKSATGARIGNGPFAHHVAAAKAAAKEEKAAAKAAATKERVASTQVVGRARRAAKGATQPKQTLKASAQIDADVEKESEMQAPATDRSDSLSSIARGIKRVSASSGSSLSGSDTSGGLDLHKHKKEHDLNDVSRSQRKTSHFFKPTT
eukprot:CAMPEP_0119344296 /NCGR_PEP_ID=MMETSP1333-20130426/106900_1 /TAXON_ID=418940 /ORGANISM="Scyphosphaera apsteinii, Strain RCC1455" /LENGTH=439 /DNA_ID=CAMNT_0007356733 /DNA_START=87 /DNA_END=1406 /DNA_ORIENTATION=+